MEWPSEWLVPDWPAPAGIRALFTTRAGGVSTPPFDSFNLGDHVRDDPAAVATNRHRLREAMGARPVFLSQIHGVEVSALHGTTPDGTEADACLTEHAGVACTVMVADCLPVLWCLPDGAAVAASHAGWRGLAGQDGHGILEATFQALAGLVCNDGVTDGVARPLHRSQGLRSWCGGAQGVLDGRHTKLRGVLRRCPPKASTWPTCRPWRACVWARWG